METSGENQSRPAAAPRDPDYEAGKKAVESKNWKLALDLFGRAVAECRALQIADTYAATSPTYARTHAGRLAFRSIASAPLAAVPMTSMPGRLSITICSPMLNIA